MLVHRRPLFTSSRAAFAGAAAPSTTWDTVASNSHFAYSGGNLIATQGANTIDTIVVGNVGHSGSGDWQVDILASSSLGQIGLMNSSQSTVDTWFAGASANSIAWDSSSGNIYLNNVNQLTLQTWASGDTITVRLKNGKLYYALNGNYTINGYTFNPTGATGGMDVSGMGTLFFCASTSGSGRSFTLSNISW